MAISTKFFHIAWTPEIQEAAAARTELANVTQNFYKITLDESLDSGIMDVSFSTRRNPYPRFDIIEIEHTEDANVIKRYFYISGDKVQLTKKGSNKTYTHTLQLIELTKKHELIPVGSRSFPKAADGTNIYTLWLVLEVLRTSTLPSIVNLVDLNLFVIDDETKTFLESFNAPELEFTNATLREAINKVLSIIDYTYRLEYSVNASTGKQEHKIVLESLNSNQQAVDFDSVDWDDYLYNSDLGIYGTHMHAKIQNEQHEKTDNFVASSQITKMATVVGFSTLEQSENENSYTGLSWRPEDGATILGGSITSNESGDNIGTELPFAIDRIEHVSISGIFNNPSNAQNEAFTHDITDRVFDKSAYDALTTEKTDNEITQYNAVHFTRGDKWIRGWSAAWPGVLLGLSTIENILRTLNGTNSARSLMVNVHFVPLVNNEASISKTSFEEVNKLSFVLQNQDETVVNPLNLGERMGSQIDRLGNGELFTTINTKILSDLKSVGNTFVLEGELYTITEAEHHVYNGFIKSRYAMSREFTRRNEFIGVDSHTEFVDIDPNKVIERDYSMLHYVLISGQSNFSRPATGKVTDALPSFFQTGFVGTFTNINNKPIRSAILEDNGRYNIPVDRLQNKPTDDLTVDIVLPVYSTAFGKSLKFNFELRSANSAGDAIDFISPAPRVKMPIIYANNGTTPTWKVNLTDYIELNVSATGGSIPSIEYINREASNLPASFRANRTQDRLFYEALFNIQKTRREQLKVSIQLLGIRGKGENQKTFFTSLCFLHNNLITNLPKSKTLYYYSSDTEEYTASDVKTKGANEGLTNNKFVRTVISGGYALKYNAVAGTSTTGSWAIGDANGNLYIGVNRKGDDRVEVAFVFYDAIPPELLYSY